jgi:hypothetical protein
MSAQIGPGKTGLKKTGLKTDSEPKTGPLFLLQ